MPEYEVENRTQNWNFLVRVPGIGSANFRTVKGLKPSVDVIEYREGGDNHGDKKYPGRPKYDNVTLERGSMENNKELYDLFKQVYDIRTNVGNEPRFSFFIYKKNRRNVIVASYQVYRALVISCEIDDFDANANDIHMERIEFAIEGFEQIM